MRKWQVLAASLLLALGAGLRLLQQRRAGDAGALPPVHVLPDGQALPESATQYYVPEQFLAVPPRSGAPTTYGPLPTIKNGIYDRGLCKGGSLNEILSAHGRIWGYEARTASFRSRETEGIYDLMGRYLACVGLARRGPEYCDYLPGQPSDGATKLDRFGTPSSRCREQYVGVAFPGFAAGREKSDSACRMMLTGRYLSEGRQLPGADFCSAAASGMENICRKFEPSLTKQELGQCRRLLPASREDCGFDGPCRARLAVYQALKAGDPAGCPEDQRGLCGAFLSGSEASCSVLLVRLGTAYCEHLADAQKRARGYAGLNPDELKDALKRDAETKAELERREEESKKVAEQVNKRVRQMLGRK